MKKYLKLLKDTYNGFTKHDPFSQSAIIAYYTLFSLPSLLVIVVTIAGYFFGRESVQDQISGEIGQFIGKDSADAIQTMITNATVEGGSFFTIALGLATLIFGATSAFFHLKKSMNQIWGVRAKKENWKRMILDRVISFGMILVIGFMLLVSLVITTLVSTLGQYISDFAPHITEFALNIFNFIISYIFIGFLFASVFKLLPDIKVRWKVTSVGASVTTILFLIGEYALSFYFGKGNPASVYGGASSVVLILLWVYYTCLIMFLGAEFTVQYALFVGESVTPNKFSEPAIFQEISEMDREKINIKNRKKALDKLGDKADPQDGNFQESD